MARVKAESTSSISAFNLSSLGLKPCWNRTWRMVRQPVTSSRFTICSNNLWWIQQSLEKCPQFLLAWDVSKFDAPQRLTSFIFILGGCRWHILQQSLSPRREILIPLPKLLENPEKFTQVQQKIDRWKTNLSPFTKVYLNSTPAHFPCGIIKAPRQTKRLYSSGA